MAYFVQLFIQNAIQKGQTSPALTASTCSISGSTNSPRGERISLALTNQNENGNLLQFTLQLAGIISFRKKFIF
jgi:hypothetical protein